MAKVEAPFTPEQVEKLKQWQTGIVPLEEGEKTDPFALAFGGHPTHPFTCCGHNGCTRPKELDDGVLIPTTEGWVCPCGKYKQNWCHKFMVE